MFSTRTKQGEWVAHAQNPLNSMGVRKELLKANMGEEQLDVWLSSDRLVNRMVFQESQSSDFWL